MKIIYEFEVEKEVEVDKVETKEENGATISITTKVKEKRPIKFGVKKPSHSEKEEAEIVKAAYFAYCVEKGVMTQASLRKRYGDSSGVHETGGVYTNEEQKQYSILRQKLKEYLEEYEFASLSTSDKTAEEKNAIFDKIFTIRRQIIDFENSATMFYQDTAESKARNKFIQFFIVMLAYIKPDGVVDWKPYFQGDNFDEKLKHLAKLEDDEDEIYLRAVEKLGLVVTLLLGTPNITKKEIEDIEKELG